jgi:hypothetical protein
LGISKTFSVSVNKVSTGKPIGSVASVA